MQQTVIPGTEPPREPEPVAESEQPAACADDCRLCHERWSPRDADGYCCECRRELRGYWAAWFGQELARYPQSDAERFANEALAAFLTRFATHEPESQP